MTITDYLQLLDFAPIALLVADEKDEILYANKIAEATFFQELKQRESQINNLNEQIANITSREKIIEWAELNNFVKVNTISYLDLSNKNLAQR